MIRYYVVPKSLEAPWPGAAPWVFPKYFGPSGASPSWAATDFGGQEPIMLVGCDLSDAEHAVMAALPDVVVWPPLDGRLTQGQYNALMNWLENRGIPSNHFSINMSSGQILREMLKIWHVNQRLNGVGLAKLVPNGSDLERKVGAMAKGDRDKLQAAIVSFGWDDRYLKDDLSLRDVVRQLAGFWDKPLRFEEIV